MSRLPELTPATSPWSLFLQPAFRIICSVSLAAMLCTWMNDLAAGWLTKAIALRGNLVQLFSRGGKLAPKSEQRWAVIGTLVLIALGVSVQALMSN